MFAEIGYPFSRTPLSMPLSRHIAQASDAHGTRANASQMEPRWLRVYTHCAVLSVRTWLWERRLWGWPATESASCILDQPQSPQAVSWTSHRVRKLYPVTMLATSAR